MEKYQYKLCQKFSESSSPPAVTRGVIKKTKALQCDYCLEKFKQRNNLFYKKQLFNSTQGKQSSSQQIGKEGVRMTFEISEQCHEHLSSDMSASRAMQGKHLNRNEKVITSQSSEPIWQCRFTTNSKEDCFLHKQTPFTSNGTARNRSRSVQNSRNSRQHEKQKIAKKSPDPHPLPISQ
ncbi:uncharacterized protein LOC111639744 [Centruroides sculpturatus]|uniref:uncharacterized protein LOC111639744 n=1 Tax=Centruroides sculpturatus TaxID=218467 RepID=UPI000C6E88C5|nr:uncharacterized protein LOC111639744 [Centruroides sculpturatus]XP_023241453.1 uncharacterized protein LOC111639744 [Centruroides sculpturatus]XP_023241454.1 uncharacterized protein LOC111639744 [Centruroides sculpturatus]